MSILWVKECISLLCRTCEPNIFVHLCTGYPFIGIFVNLDTRFVKSLGMLTSTALQACLIPFSSLFLFLPGPPETSYRFSLSGPLGWQSGIATHALRQDYSLISGWQLSVLKKKPKKENLRVSLTQYFCHLRIPFSLLLRYTADLDDHCSLIQSSAIASHLWKISLHTAAFCQIS